jgi:hypothetical protein
VTGAAGAPRAEHAGSTYSTCVSGGTISTSWTACAVELGRNAWMKVHGMVWELSATKCTVESEQGMQVESTSHEQMLDVCSTALPPATVTTVMTCTR